MPSNASRLVPALVSSGHPGMAQLMRSDDEVRAAQSGVLGGGDQAVAQPSQPETVAAGDEYEIELRRD
ncbi:hypothetical protein LRQ08_29695 (plasmid) [Rhodococcus qingshengii]|nr:hypothetical protein [Rhodococcus qingshengii]UUE28636.1 hypothetical protein LRQ08_29695 [Rhodococcus qingshengii]